MNGPIVYSYKPKEGAEAEAYERLSDLCMSIRKEDVLRLPGQTYENVELTPSPDLLKKYKKFERDKVLECLDEQGEIVAGSAAALTNKLLQFANGAIYDSEGGVHELHSIKLDALEELVEAAGGDPVLILYNYRHDADRIRARIPCRMLDKPADIDAESSGRRTHSHLVRPHLVAGALPAGQRAPEPPRSEKPLPDLPFNTEGNARRARAPCADRKGQGAGRRPRSPASGNRAERISCPCARIWKG